jgi:hypothetical protein
MRHALISMALFAAFALLANCASPARVDVRDRMVGLSAAQLATCMGEPARKEDVGKTEVWTYYAPDTSYARPLDASMIPRHLPPMGDMGLNACLVTVKLEASRVMAVDYVNMASTREDAGCANAIQRCSR